MMRSTAPSSVTTNDAMRVGAPRLTSHSCSGANNTASTGIPMIPVAYRPRDHRIATPSAMTMNAARWCLVSRNAKLFAAFHPQHARQRRAIVGERDEIVAGRDLIRPAAESAEPAAAGRATERLRDEPEGAKATTTAAAPASPRFSQEIAERGEETRIGLVVARLAAAFTAGCRQTRRIRDRARRRLARPLDEATRCRKGRAAAPAAAPPPPATTAAAAKSEALRDALHVTGEQQLLDRIELLGVTAGFLQRIEHHVDPLHEPRAVALLRRGERDRRRIAALEIPDDAMQARRRRTLNRAHRVAAHVANHDRRAGATIAAALREPVHDLRAILRARRPELLLAVVAAAERGLAVLVSGVRLEQIRAGREDRVGELLERRDVHDPQRAAVRRDHQVAIARVNPNVVHRHHRQAAHELLP